MNSYLEIKQTVRQEQSKKYFDDHKTIESLHCGWTASKKNHRVLTVIKTPLKNKHFSRAGVAVYSNLLKGATRIFLYVSHDIIEKKILLGAKEI